MGPCRSGAGRTGPRSSGASPPAGDPEALEKQPLPVLPWAALTPCAKRGESISRVLEGCGAPRASAPQPGTPTLRPARQSHGSRRRGRGAPGGEAARPPASAVSPRAAPGSQKVSRAGGMRPLPQPRSAGVAADAPRGGPGGPGVGEFHSHWVSARPRAGGFSCEIKQSLTLQKKTAWGAGAEAGGFGRCSRTPHTPVVLIPFTHRRLPTCCWHCPAVGLLPRENPESAASP